MPKLFTPAMQKQANRKAKSNAIREGSSLGREAFKRLKRNRTAIVGMTIIVLLLLLAIFADFIAPYHYAKQDYSAILQPPSAQHWFGTDQLGRDVFSRCVYGARYSIPIGLACVLSSLIVGGLIGSTAAFFGGQADTILMRIMDVFQSIPSMLMSIAIIAALGNGVSKLIMAITITFMPAFAKTCRAAIFTVKGNEYIESSRAIGSEGFNLLFRHMIPNGVGPIIISAVSMMASSIMIVSTLSYLGLGISPPTPEWGVLLSDGKEYLRGSPYLVMFPGLMIMIAVFGFNLFGDGLRDALDPRLK